MKSLAALLLLWALPAAAELRVGASAVDITPDLASGKVFLSGFNPYFPFAFRDNRWAEGIHDKIWARGLAIQGSSGERVLLIATDLPGLAWKHIDPVRRELEETLGIPRGNIIIHSTHTHSAPDASGYWSTFIAGHNTDYTLWLRRLLFHAGVQALTRMQPAKMRSVLTTHFSCIDARTKALKREPDCNLPPHEAEFGQPGTEWDRYLIQSDERDPIVRNTRIVAAQFAHTGTGKTIATFLNWNNHPDTLDSSNRLLSSDYPHYLRQFVERALGGIAVYFVGTLGNQIGALHGVPAPLWDENFQRVLSGELDAEGRPLPAFVDQGFDQIRSIGYEIGDEAVRALRLAAWATDDPPVWIKTEPLDVSIDNFVHVVFTASCWNQDVEREDRLRKYRPHCTSIHGCVRTDVSVLQIGDLGIATAPGEIDPAYFFGRKESVANYGKKWGKWTFPAMPSVARYLPGRIHLMIGSANNYLSYLVPTGDNVGWWKFGHPNLYEEQVTVGRDFGDDVGNKLMQMLGSTERYSQREIFP